MSLLPRPTSSKGRRVLLTLRDDGAQSRAELGAKLGLTRSRLSVEADRLISAGLVEDGGQAVSTGGRPPSTLKIAGNLRFAGLDIGATSINAVLSDGELRIVARASEPIDIADGPVRALDRAAAMVNQLMADSGARDVHGVGVGVPGPVSAEEGRVIAPPIMPGWDSYPIRDALSERLGCTVAVDNDVNVAALGELSSPEAQGARDFLVVKLGTGIGCGIIVDGQVYRGVTGSAGDIGHIEADPGGPMCACGRRGCLEACFSGAALARRATQAAATGDAPALAQALEAAGELTAVDVGRAAAAGDQFSAELVRDGGRLVGKVLAGIVNFFNPSLIVISGGLTGLGAPLLAEIRAVIYRRSLALATRNLSIVMSGGSQWVAPAGALRLVTDQVFSVARP